MSDSVDRVFVHALNTVKRIPRTRSARPPDADRLKLYGLYKQSMEGDVEDVIGRPDANAAEPGDGVSEREKWEAWQDNAGKTRTEAKRQYITTLIETMHRYATTTPEARELVGELEFLWDQIKSNSVSPSGSLPGHNADTRTDQQSPPSQFSKLQGESRTGLRVLGPQSEDVEDADLDDFDYDHSLAFQDGNMFDSNGTGLASDLDVGSQKWRKRIEQALVKMTAEIAALREQMEATRFGSGQRRIRVSVGILSLAWATIRHISIDAALLGLLILWARRRQDPMVEQGLRMFSSWLRMQLAGIRVPGAIRARSRR